MEPTTWSARFSWIQGAATRQEAATKRSSRGGSTTYDRDGNASDEAIDTTAGIRGLISQILTVAATT